MAGRTESASDELHHRYSVWANVRSVAGKQDAGDVGGRVDLRPMPGFEHVKGGISSVGSDVFGDADM
jgi:hypothetical protein